MRRSWGLRIGVVALAALLALLTGGGDAEAAKKRKTTTPLDDLKPMTFTIVRHAAPECEPWCAEWIAAEGDIGPGSIRAFKKVLKAMGKRKLPVLMNSRGGSVDDAIAVGRLIRQRGLDVAVARTEFATCGQDVKDCKDGRAPKGSRGRPVSMDSICASACAFMLAGGQRRFVSVWAQIGVHAVKWYQTPVRIERRYRIETWKAPNGTVMRKKRTLVSERRVTGKTKQGAGTDRQYRDIAKYLNAMGIKPSLLALVKSTPHESMHYLNRSETVDMEIVTDVRGAEYLIAEVEAATATSLASRAKATTEPSSGEREITAQITRPLGRFRSKQVEVWIGLKHVRGRDNFTILLAPMENLVRASTDSIDARISVDGARSVLAKNAYRKFSPLSTSMPVAWICDRKNPPLPLNIVMSEDGRSEPHFQAYTIVGISQMSQGRELWESACPAPH